MGHSRAEKAQSRERILTGAAAEIRRNGLDALAIADVMKSAGLTHGAFYSHFPSRDALIGAAVDHALVAGEARSTAAVADRAAGDVMAMVRSYLSPAHRDTPDSGCAVAALAGEAARSEVARDRVGDRVTRYVGRMATALGDRPDAIGEAWSIWSTMVGALTLSRLLAGDASDAVLRSACDAIERIVDPAAR
jgi:TetR/AcrR family transcriptional repressor of nem operon